MVQKHYEKPMPETVTTILEDGRVSVSVGHFTGIVSSMHLIEPKAHQLQKAWLKHQMDLVDASN
jgi:hypothetical protein